MKLSEVKEIGKIKVIQDGEFKNTGKITTDLSDLLVMITSEKYLSFITPNITSIICPPDLVDVVRIDRIGLAISENPRESFTLIHNHIANKRYTDHVSIGMGCVIHNNVSLGINGFEYAQTNEHPLQLYHKGKLIIGDHVDIHPGSTVQRGRFTDTIIGDGVKIDCMVHIAHEVEIGENTMIAAGSMIAGNAKIGKNVFIAPMCSIRNGVRIGDGAYISLGSVVTKDVPKGVHVTGYFAVPHEQFLAGFKHFLSASDTTFRG